MLLTEDEFPARSTRVWEAAACVRRANAQATRRMPTTVRRRSCGCSSSRCRHVRPTAARAFRIASNLVVDHWRAHKREAPVDVPERSAQAGNYALRLDVGRIFARLKPRERQLVWSRTSTVRTTREIAATLGLRAGSIRVLLSRARKRVGADAARTWSRT